MTCRTIALATMMLCILPVAAIADNHGTKSQQDACQADVFKVCRDAVPDEKKIVDCLNDNLPKLSFKCQLLIEPDPSKRTKQF